MIKVDYQQSTTTRYRQSRCGAGAQVPCQPPWRNALSELNSNLPSDFPSSVPDFLRAGHRYPQNQADGGRFPDTSGVLESDDGYYLRMIGKADLNV